LIKTILTGNILLSTISGERRGEVKRWGTVVAVGVAVFMAGLDMSITNVALPTLAREFDVDPNGVTWVVMAYNLPLVALLLPLGRWVDFLDKRGAFLVAVLGFAVASALCGLAPSLSWVIGARLLQGAFGALIGVLVPVLAMRAVEPGQRGRAMGIVGILGPLGSVSGPAVGGLLLASLGWRSIFFAVVPACLLAALIGWRAISPGREDAFTLPRLTWVAEATLLFVATAALFLALDQIPAAGSVGPVSLALFGISVLGVILWRRLPAAKPVVLLVSTRDFGAAAGGFVLLATVGGALFYLPPFFLQDVLRLPPQEAGLTLLAWPLAMSAVGPVGGYLADRWGTSLASLLGAVWIAGALALLLPLSTEWSSVDVAWRLGLIGVGAGLFTAPIQTALMSAAPAHLMGTAGALSGLARSLGFALGPALASAVWVYAGSGVGGMRTSLYAALAVAMLAVVAAWVGRSAPGTSTQTHRQG
jgi:EmrB/QacA subfamily drug resistance transporter